LKKKPKGEDISIRLKYRKRQGTTAKCIHQTLENIKKTDITARKNNEMGSIFQVWQQ
jgi:hypothetical protein